MTVKINEYNIPELRQIKHFAEGVSALGCVCACVRVFVLCHQSITEKNLQMRERDTTIVGGKIVGGVRLPESFGSDIFVEYFLRVRDGITVISDIRTLLCSSNTFK